MKKYNRVEVILFSKYFAADIRQKSLVRWLGTTLQSTIARQQDKAKKIFPGILRICPPFTCHRQKYIEL